MVDSLRAGQIDGFCVGEPWNSLAVERDIGRIVVTKAQIFPQSIEKVLAVNAGLEADRETLDALLAALRAASRPSRAAKTRSGRMRRCCAGARPFRTPRASGSRHVFIGRICTSARWAGCRRVSPRH
jgi:hypothetical protein